MVKDGKVPFSFLAKKLDSFQKSLYNVASAMGGGPVGRRGAYDKHIRVACELFLYPLAEGSYKIIAEIPDPSLLEYPLFEHEDLGLKSLKIYKDVLINLQEKNTKKITQLLPNFDARLRALKSIHRLCPKYNEEFWIEVSNGIDGAYSKLTDKTYEYLESLFEEDSEEAVTSTIHGQLIEIRVLSGRNHIILRSQQREIVCYYSREIEDTITQLVAGSLVEVRGRAQLSEDNRVRQIDEIMDVSTIDLFPFKKSTFSWGDKKYILKEPVTCLQDFRNDIWVYECPKYNLHSYGDDRQQVLRDFEEGFIFLCEELLEEDDENLTAGAIKLRERLKSDIGEVQNL